MLLLPEYPKLGLKNVLDDFNRASKQIWVIAIKKNQLTITYILSS